MYKNQIKALELLLLLFTFLKVYSQGNPSLPQVIPPSPDAVSLGKYGEIPVGKYTGTANIGVPIYTIDFDGLKIPIALNYHTAGIKVEELASWVGLGWSLSAGGIITKSIVGIPDEAPRIGYLNNSYQITSIQGLSNAEQEKIAAEVKNGLLDIEPDNYYYNILGHSGRFIIDKETKRIHTIPKSSLKFTFTPSGIVVVDSKGFKYIFNEGETTIIDPNYWGTPHNYTSSSTSVLTKIISPAGNEITFSYQNYTNSYYTRGGQSIKYLIGGGCYCGGNGRSCVDGYNEVKNNFFINEILGKRLRQITWDEGKVVFNKTANNREDIVNDYALDNIEVFNYQGYQISKHKLFYSYGNSSTNMNLFSSYFTSLIGGKRIFLDSVKQISDSRYIPPYTFNYTDKNNLPYYLSPAQDHWGYYNGEYLNPNLLSIVGLKEYNDRTFGFAKRNINTSNAKAGLLSKIMYPTGGTTDFTYESNEGLVEVCDYVHTINPNNMYGLEPVITAYVNYAQREDYINVPPSICGETKKKFTYVVNFPRQINCSSGTRDCVGTLQVRLINQVNGESINLLNNPIINGQTKGEVNLVAGATYLLFLDGNASDVNGVSATVKGYKNPVLVPGTTKVSTKVGGLRIVKQVSSAEGSPTLITKYNYVDRQNILDTAIIGQFTSGRIMGLPRYAYHDEYNIYVEYDNPQGGTSGEQAYCRYLNISSSSLAPMSDDNGFHVGYKMVEEIRDGGTAEQIKKVNTFSSTDEYPDLKSDSYPYITTTSYNYARGMPLKEYSLLYNPSLKTYNLLKEVENRYALSGESVQIVFGLRSACSSYYRNQAMFAADIPMQCQSSLFKLYNKRSQFVYLSSTIEKEFDKNNFSRFTQTQATFEYNNLNHFEVTSTTVFNSKGEIIRTDNKYPHDFALTAPYDEMIINNFISPIIESKITNVTKNKELSLTKSNYSQSSWGIIKPESVQKSILGSPLETEISFTKYDNRGNLLQFTSRDGTITCFVWGYNQQYPVAKIIGKSYDDIIAQSGINLVLLINPLDDASIQSELSKLRTVQGVFVTTYTYKPLVGITCETDPRGRNIYYDYDVFNRLILVRDHDKNILKKICYNYAGQPEDCSSPCVANWQNTNTPYRCQLDTWGNNTGYVEYEQKDINPCSATYNQIRWHAERNEDLCPSAITIKATNLSGFDGYIAEYKNSGTGQSFSFSISKQTTLQTIGSLPAGSYTLKIYHPSELNTLRFNAGCTGISEITGESASFSNILVTQSDCTSITINK